MEASPGAAAQSVAETRRLSGLPPPNKAPRPLRVGDVQFYRVCEDLTEAIIYGTAVFGPWAFGTTQAWAMWTVNWAGFALGGLLACKVAIRWIRGYKPPRWEASECGASERGALEPKEPLQSKRSDAPRSDAPRPLPGVASLSAQLLSRILAWLTVAILSYCLVSALNARSTYHREALSFDYHSYLKWLPHSFDSGRTWFVFWSYLGMACWFWAARDWLLGKAGSEERAPRHKSSGSFEAAPLLPARLRRLLWVLAVNGGLLGVESVVQRLSGSSKLLFLVQPHVNPEGETQFGPYAYRANASQYFNLLWPVCLGFWWTLQQSGGLKRPAPYVVLFVSIVMAACPTISTCRGGALVTAGIIVLALVLFAGLQIFIVQRRESRRKGRLALATMASCFVAALALAYGLGWKTLKPRMAQLQEGYENREQMYDAARPMSADYPLFGTGPGTFETVFQLYRISTETYWPAQLHNDWLETRITFGWLGSVMIWAALAAVLLRWFGPGGIHGGRRFMILVWLALAGCLVHARFDFPFQIHSILSLFLLMCAVIFTLSRRPSVV